MTGKVQPSKLSAKMANTIATSNKLQDILTCATASGPLMLMQRGGWGGRSCKNKTRLEVSQRRAEKYHSHMIDGLSH
ncbi:hypothetical protein [Hyphomicrobium sp. D-2]|uniref:hypothetical protein n=1 Tax=Hyphomicrobium sp. D-2 TaxID=3041621 RepID=UPI002458F9D8|nr:hypothetical protein [Hyphomicrobium sp. D-2]MDH4981352.1 hypothetical protein [Hyphomicrobium sp. D-2]